LFFTQIGIFIFAIMGTNIFAGYLGSCSDGSVAGRTSCQGNWQELGTDCSSMEVTVSQIALCGRVFKPRAWQNPERNFDNIGNSYIALFEVASLDKWVPLMHATMDIKGLTDQPAVNNAAYNAVFLVAFVFVAGLFSLKLFTAVVIDTFNQANTSNTKLLTEWRTDKPVRNLHDKLSKYLDIIAPEPVSDRPIHNPLRCFCYDICVRWDPHEPARHGSQAQLHYVRKHFNNFITLCLCVNIILMFSKHSDEPSWWTDALRICDHVFVGIFTIEVLIKMLAILPIHFFRSSWNCFDFLLVVGTLIGEIWSSADASDKTASILRRSFEAMRVARLLRFSRRLRCVANALGASVYGILNVVLLLAVVISSYAALGVHSFGETKYGVVLGRTLGFTQFPHAVAALIRVGTGEWVDLRLDCGRAWPLCTTGVDCGSPISIPYFFTFLVLVYYIIANMVVAVVMEQFTWMYSLEKTTASCAVQISTDDLHEFEREWQKLDPVGRGTIMINDLAMFIRRLRPPLGRPDPDKTWLNEINIELESMPGHIRGEIRFKELFAVLAMAATSEDDQPDISDTNWMLFSPEVGEKTDSSLVSPSAGPWDAGSRPVSRQDVVAEMDSEMNFEQSISGVSEPPQQLTGEGCAVGGLGRGHELPGAVAIDVGVVPEPPGQHDAIVDNQDEAIVDHGAGALDWEQLLAASTATPGEGDCQTGKDDPVAAESGPATKKEDEESAVAPPEESADSVGSQEQASGQDLSEEVVSAPAPKEESKEMVEPENLAQAQGHKEPTSSAVQPEESADAVGSQEQSS